MYHIISFTLLLTSIYAYKDCTYIFCKKIKANVIHPYMDVKECFTPKFGVPDWTLVLTFFFIFIKNEEKCGTSIAEHYEIMFSNAYKDCTFSGIPFLHFFYKKMYGCITLFHNVKQRMYHIFLQKM